MKSIVGTASITGAAIAALLVGMSGQAALADDGYRHDRRDRIESDRRALREDEERLHHLERRLDDETRNHEWHAARETRRDIDRVHCDIDQDHRNLDRDRR